MPTTKQQKINIDALHAPQLPITYTSPVPAYDQRNLPLNLLAIILSHVCYRFCLFRVLSCFPRPHKHRGARGSTSAAVMLSGHLRRVQDTSTSVANALFEETS